MLVEGMLILGDLIWYLLGEYSVSQLTVLIVTTRIYPLISPFLCDDKS